MNRFLEKQFLLIALITIILLIILAKIPSYFDNNDILDLQIVVSTTTEDVTHDDIELVKGEVEKAIKFIPQILGVNYNKKIKIHIVDEGICNAQGSIISLPILHVRDKSAAIIHELAHIIAKHENNSFFSEGLAVYLQEKYGNFKSFPNYSLHLDDVLRNNKEQLISLSVLKNDNEIFQQVGTEKRRLAYIEAGSFINFLVVKYGVQKLTELHQSNSLNYLLIYGKTFEELEAEWKKYVFSGQLSESL